MTPEEVAAIREKWAKDVTGSDVRPFSLIDHENELRQTIRDLCDELFDAWARLGNQR